LLLDLFNIAALQLIFMMLYDSINVYCYHLRSLAATRNKPFSSLGCWGHSWRKDEVLAPQIDCVARTCVVRCVAGRKQVLMARLVTDSIILVTEISY